MGLAYLIRLCGYKNVQNVVYEKEMMGEIIFILNEIKARAMATFRLTLSEIDMADNSNFSRHEEVANPLVGAGLDDAKKAQFEVFFGESFKQKV